MTGIIHIFTFRDFLKAGRYCTQFNYSHALKYLPFFPQNSHSYHRWESIW